MIFIHFTFILQAIDDLGCTPLHEAATYGCLQIARELLTRDANVKVRDNSGGTALHYVAMEDGIELAKVMFEGRNKSEVSEVSV